MRLKVFRFRPEIGQTRYDTFEMEAEPGMTVLSALFKFQEEFDDSLAFRYSCRGAVCGSCAMLINKVPRLACRTQVMPLLAGEQKISLSGYPDIGGTISWDPKEEVLVEPLPNLPVICDLVVDMSRFFDFYRDIDPAFHPLGPDPEKERLMDPSAVRELELYTNCILCGACFAACPVDAKNPEFSGPAALASLYRFCIDPREGRRIERLMTADTPDGWWGCEFHANCRQVCPRGVPPITAIGQARREIEKQRKEGEGTAKNRYSKEE